MDVRKVLLGCVSIALAGTPLASARSQPYAPATATIDAAGALTPSVLSFRADTRVPVWHNADATAHTVTFANGRCTLDLQSGASDLCSDTFWRYVGTYPYTVSGAAPSSAVVRVTPAQRSISLAASATAVASGAAVRLSGAVSVELGPPAPVARGAAVTVVALSRRGRARTVGRIGSPCQMMLNGTCSWTLVVHPRHDTRYEARAWSEPSGGIVWQRATSRVVRVRVR